jgi:hypothetical protein
MACSIASNRGREEWLETAATSGVVDVLVPLRVQTKESISVISGDREALQ